MNIVTTIVPLMTEANIAVVVDLKMLYKNDTAKNIILVMWGHNHQSQWIERYMSNTRLTPIGALHKEGCEP